jgi:hypothetical protein
MKGTDRQSIEFGGRSLVLAFKKGELTIISDGREVYSGAIAPTSQADSDALAAEVGNLPKLLSEAIKAAREAIRRGQSLAFNIGRQAASAPTA